MNTYTRSRNIRNAFIAVLFLVMLVAVAWPVTATATSHNNNTVDSSSVVDQSLLSVDLARDSVGASEIRSGAVGSSELRADSVGRSELNSVVEGAICPSGWQMVHAHVMVFDEGVTVEQFSNASTAERVEMAEIVGTHICQPIPPTS